MRAPAAPVAVEARPAAARRRRTTSASVSAASDSAALSRSTTSHSAWHSASSSVLPEARPLVWERYSSVAAGAGAYGHTTGVSGAEGGGSLGRGPPPAHPSLRGGGEGRRGGAGEAGGGDRPP